MTRQELEDSRRRDRRVSQAEINRRVQALRAAGDDEDPFGPRTPQDGASDPKPLSTCRQCHGTGRVSIRYAFAGICTGCWGTGRVR